MNATANAISTERTLTELDHVRLTHLLQRQAGLPVPMRRQVGELLDLAQVVPSREVAPQVVTMYSQVMLRDLQLDTQSKLTLCYPADADPATGLFDPTGYFPHRTDPTRVHASPDAVALEIRAQFEKALTFGIDVTHIDSHMLSVFTPAYLPLYLGLAFEHHVPAFALRQDVDELRARGFDEAGAADLVRVTNEFEERGLPIFDHVYCMSLNTDQGRVAEATRALAECPPGLTHFIVHPASDTPELQAIAPDWRSRVADRALFLDETWRSAVAGSGVHVIGYRALRDAIRAD